LRPRFSCKSTALTYVARVRACPRVPSLMYPSRTREALPSYRTSNTLWRDLPTRPPGGSELHRRGRTPAQIAQARDSEQSQLADPRDRVGARGDVELAKGCRESAASPANDGAARRAQSLSTSRRVAWRSRRAPGRRRRATERRGRTQSLRGRSSRRRPPSGARRGCSGSAPPRYAERFVRTVRNECLDWLLILGRRHLEHVLRIYVQHYNRERPHRGLALTPPEPAEIKPSPGGDVQRRDRLGGLIHEYYRTAA
jgi:Integrase core domain